MPLSKGLLRVRAPHLFVGHWDQPVLGQLPHHAEVRPHVQLATHQHHFGAGTELLRLPLPLEEQSTRTSITDVLSHKAVCSITPGELETGNKSVASLCFQKERPLDLYLGITVWTESELMVFANIGVCPGSAVL